MKKVLYCIIVMLFLSAVAGCSFLAEIYDYSKSRGTQPPPAEDGEPPESGEPGTATTPGQPVPGGPGGPDGDGITNISDRPGQEFRAVWVATLINLDFPSVQNLSAAAMRREIDAIVASTASMGLTAIILQVRPAGDAFYESGIFPWSMWLTGVQGRGIPGFDPLAYWIESCHAAGLELHAWLNPYRIIHTSLNSSDPETLAPGHPVRRNPGLAVGWKASNGNSGLFLDPGLPESRRLIYDGVTEIIKKYDVDGIHIDDYFYPGADFDDSASFALYGDGAPLADWRRENVNKLVKGIQEVIWKLNLELDKNVRWGISPTAIWKNSSSDPLGVPTTRGQESYHALCGYAPLGHGKVGRLYLPADILVHWL